MLFDSICIAALNGLVELVQIGMGLGWAIARVRRPPLGDPAQISGERTARVFDPVEVSTSLLFPAQRLAIRMVGFPVDRSTGVARGFLGDGESLASAGKGDRRTENLGTKVIVGLTCVGTRATITSNEHPSISETAEEWVSKASGLVAL